MKLSENPRPGNEGQTIWYAWPPSCGFDKALNNGVKLRLVNGKLGSNSRGMADPNGDLMCIKCILSGVGAGKPTGDGGGSMARRNCGSAVFSWVSMARQS